MRVLGISLGTTTTGIAVMEEGKLIASKTHSFRYTWSARKADQITSCYQRYLKQFEPSFACIKIPALTHHTDAIKELLKKVAALFAYHGCMVEYKTKEEVKTQYPLLQNQYKLMKYVTQQYPTLLPEFTTATSRKNQYHAKLFDAVMMAHQGNEHHRNNSGHDNMPYSP